MSNVFGTPKFGSSGGDYKRTRAVGAGDTLARLLPPMFSLRETGEWRKYFATHWGYEVQSERDASKKYQKPFRCIEDKDRRSGLIRQECPACKKYKEKEAELKALTAAIRADVTAKMVGKDPAFIEKMVEERVAKETAGLVQWLEDHRVDGKWYVNAMFEDGTFGSIKYNHKFHMAQIMEIINGKDDGKSPPVPGLLEAEGINPLDPSQGVWFVCHRTGAKRNVVDTITVKMENVVVQHEGKTRNMKEIVLAPLTEAQCEQAGKDCEDLATLGGDSLTYEQIEALVNGNAIPAAAPDPAKEAAEAAAVAARIAAARIAADAQAAADKAAKQAQEDAAVAAAAEKASTEAAKAAVAAANAPAPAAEVKAQDPAVIAKQKEMIAQRLADIAARKAAVEAEALRKAEEEKAAAAKAAEPATEVDFANMSDEEFSRTFGPGASA